MAEPLTKDQFVAALKEACEADEVAEFIKSWEVLKEAWRAAQDQAIAKRTNIILFKWPEGGKPAWNKFSDYIEKDYEDIGTDRMDEKRFKPKPTRARTDN